MTPSRPGARHAYPRGPAFRDPSRSGPPMPPAKVQLGWVVACPNFTCDTELLILPEQGGRVVECPTCGTRFESPPELLPEDEDRLTVVQSVEEGRAAEREQRAAEALTGLSKDRLPRRARSVERRAGEARAHLAAPPEPDPHAPRRPKRHGLAVLWLAALLASGGTIAAAWALGTPDLALACLVFLGLAVGGTVAARG